MPITKSHYLEFLTVAYSSQTLFPFSTDLPGNIWSGAGWGWQLFALGSQNHSQWWFCVCFLHAQGLPDGHFLAPGCTQKNWLWPTVWHGACLHISGFPCWESAGFVLWFGCFLPPFVAQRVLVLPAFPLPVNALLLQGHRGMWPAWGDSRAWQLSLSLTEMLEAKYCTKQNE